MLSGILRKFLDLGFIEFFVIELFVDIDICDFFFFCFREFCGLFVCVYNIFGLYNFLDLSLFFENRRGL